MHGALAGNVVRYLLAPEQGGPVAASVDNGHACMPALRTTAVRSTPTRLETPSEILQIADGDMSP